MTPEQRESKECELRCLIADMTAPVKDIADFKVIKNIEVFLTTLTAEQKAALPYNPDTLHTSREATRTRIRQLETELTATTE